MASSVSKPTTTATTTIQNGSQTISIASGTTFYGTKSLTLSEKSTDPAELDQFLSKLIPTITTTTTTASATITSSIITTTTTPPNQTSLVFVTGSPTASSTPSPSANASQSDSTPDLGAIIGGCAGGFVLLMILTFVFCIRRKNEKEKEFIYNNFAQTQRSFYRDKDNNIVPVTTIQTFQTFQPNISKPPKALDPAGQGQYDSRGYQINNNDATIKCYNLTTDIETSEKTQLSPRNPSFNLYSPNYLQHTETHDHQTETTSITMQPVEFDQRYQSPTYEQQQQQTQYSSFSPSALSADDFADQSTIVNHHQTPPQYMTNNLTHLQANNLTHLQTNNNSFLTEVSRYNTMLQRQPDFNDGQPPQNKNKPYQYI